MRRFIHNLVLNILHIRTVLFYYIFYFLLNNGVRLMRRYTICDMILGVLQMLFFDCFNQQEFFLKKIYAMAVLDSNISDVLRGQ